MKPHITSHRTSLLGRVWNISDGKFTLFACLCPSRGLKDWLRIKSSM